MGARKSRRKPGKKRKKTKKSTSLERLEKKILERGIIGGHPTKVLKRHPEKMSRVILDFAEPLLDEIPEDDEKGVKNAVVFSILAWNLSLLPKENRGELLAPFLTEMKSKKGSDTSRAMLETFDLMIERKEDLYPDNTRSIIEYEFVEEKEEIQLNVVSTVMSPE